MQKEITEAVSSVVNGLMDFYVEFVENMGRTVTARNGNKYDIYPCLDGDLAVEMCVSGAKINFSLSLGEARHTEASER